MRLEPRQESAKTTFQWHLLARDLLLNKLRCKRLQMNLPVKRVENRTGDRTGDHTGDQKYWSYSVDSDKTRMPSNMVLLQGQVITIPTFPYGVDRRKISTLLTGVISGIFSVRF